MKLKNKRGNKKGELTTQQIVTLIILITSFIVILFFIFYLNLGEESDFLKCQNSVALRGSSDLTANTVPLDCKTHYVCITADGTCESMTSPDIKEVKTKSEVYGVLAKEMRDCWAMFGRGKINYVENNILPNNLYCSICSQIAFDDSLKTDKFFINGFIDQEDFYENYLAKTKISGEDMTYLEYLYGIRDYSGLESFLVSENIGFDQINLDKHHYVLMGITAEVSTLSYIAGGAVVVGAATLYFVGAPASIPATVGFVLLSAAGGTTGYFVGTTLEGESGNEFMPPILLEVDSDKFEKLECEDVKTLS